MARSNRRRPLHVESLERRDTPAVSLVGGVLTVTGTWGNDVITLDTYGSTVRVSENNVLHTRNAADVTSIEVKPGLGNDTVHLQRLFAGKPVLVDPGLGTNTVNLTPTAGAQDLDRLLSRVTVQGSGGLDTVSLYDRSHVSNIGYRVRADEVVSTAFRPFGGLTYQGIDNLNLTTHNPVSQVNVDATPSGSTLSVYGGGYADGFHVGDGNLDHVRGLVRLHGGAGAWADHVTVLDGAASALFDDTYTLTSSTVTRPYFGGLEYYQMEGLTLSGQPGDNEFRIVSTSATTPMTLQAGGGVDTIVAPDVANTWMLRDAWNSTVGNVTFRDAEHLRGGGVADTFRFQPGSGTWAGIDGRTGTDLMDYSALTAGVSVDLEAGTAARVTGTVSGMENVTGTSYADTLRGDAGNNVLVAMGGGDVMHGGAGDDTMDGGAGNDDLDGGDGNDLMRAGLGNDSAVGGIGADVMYAGAGDDSMNGAGGHDWLFGEAGNDSLHGGNARDIVFGGDGFDVLGGGAYDDILASGNLSYMNNQTALSAIMAEWVSARDYWDRVWNLRGVAANSPTYGARANGTYYLTTGVGGSVTQPVGGAQDQMTGGLAGPTDDNHDWFFGHAAEYPDREAGEAVN